MADPTDPKPEVQKVPMRLDRGADPCPEIPVHRFAVCPTYDDGWPVTILLVQYSPAERATAAVAIRAERQALRMLMDTVEEQFRATVGTNSTQDPSALHLSREQIKNLTSLDPAHWISATLAAARMATTFNGADVEWYEVPAIDVSQWVKEKKDIVALRSFRTPMTSSCLAGLLDEFTRLLGGSERSDKELEVGDEHSP